MHMAGGWVYILTNRPNGTLYVGVTGDLPRRINQHRTGVVDGFTRRYGLRRLVYVEHHADIRAAIQREKNIKHWPRAWKVRLILDANPRWEDLYDQLDEARRKGVDGRVRSPAMTIKLARLAAIARPCLSPPPPCRKGPAMPAHSVG